MKDVTKSRECLQTLEGHSDDVNSVSFSPDGTKVASGSVVDKTVKLWDVTSGSVCRRWRGILEDVTVCRFLQMGRRLRRGLMTRR